MVDSGGQDTLKSQTNTPHRLQQSSDSAVAGSLVTFEWHVLCIPQMPRLLRDSRPDSESGISDCDRVHISATNIPHKAFFWGEVYTSIKSSKICKSKMPHQRQWSCFAWVPWMTRRLRKRTTHLPNDGGWNLPCFLFAAQLLVSPTHLSVSEWVAGCVKWQLPLERSTDVQRAFLWEMQQPTNKP